MQTIFINYRREDSQAQAGRLADQLRWHLPDTTVFMDVDGIAPGADFIKQIGDELSACNVFISVIGPRWLNLKSRLRRRLFLPNDFVRLEIVAALKRPIAIIPVLVGGAKMPSESSLPPSIEGLATRNALTLRDDRFPVDAAALVEIVKSNLANSAPLDLGARDAERMHIAQILEADIAAVTKACKRKTRIIVAVSLLSFSVVTGTVAFTYFRTPEPHFAEALTTPDPQSLRVPHPNDIREWAIRANPQHGFRAESFPHPRGGPEPVLTLAQALGSGGTNAVSAIQKTGSIVFQAVGSTGLTKAPMESRLPALMLRDFGIRGLPQPSFLYLLGDVILNFGEGKYYYDQFYSPFRNYPAPIFAVPGNHDGIVALGSSTRTLDAFLANFCADGFHVSADAMQLHRTAQIQPGVYFTFDAPFVRVLGLYSNIMEDQGHISTEGDKIPELNNDQLQFLETALTRAREENYPGALIVAVHHDFYSADDRNPVSSPAMLADIDSVCNKAGIWPHLILSGHAHNYQRFLRTVGTRKVLYVVGGTGNNHFHRIRTAKPGMVVTTANDQITLKSFDDNEPGYLRMTVDRKQLVGEFQTPSNGVRDRFTINLKTHLMEE